VAPRPAGAAQPRPLEFPAPDLPLTVAPLPLGVVPPALAVPPPPPLDGPSVETAALPLPRFTTAILKPLPPAADPGAFSCTFAAFRRAAGSRDCGVHRALHGEWPEARAALEESLAIDPGGEHALEASLWLGEVLVREGRWDLAERRYRAALGGALRPDLRPHAALGGALGALRRGDAADARARLAGAMVPATPQPLALLARFLDGVIHLLEDRPADALARWEPLAQSGAPGTLTEELLFWRGVALARQGDVDAGLRELDRFVGLVGPGHPLRVEALVQSGWLALERRAADDAVRRFFLADAGGLRAEQRADARAGLIRAYVALGDTARAVAQARQLDREVPRDPRVAAALLVIAEDATRRGARAEAIDVYRQLRALHVAPAIAEYATYRLGEALEGEGRLAEARVTYRELRERGRDEATAQRAAYRLGLLDLAERNPGAARDEGEALLRAGAIPELREGAVLLAAEGAARAGDPNRAAGLFRVALREFPASSRAPAVRLALGWALLADREPEAALREWEGLVRGADLETAAQAYLAIADVALRQGQESRSLAALRALRSLVPAHPLADLIALDLGVLAVRAGAHAEAVGALEPLPARTTDPGRQMLARRALALARYRLGHYEVAERQFREVARLVLADPPSWLGAGLAAYHQGRLAEADDALQRARAHAAPEVAAAAWYGQVLAAYRRGDAVGFRDQATAFVDRYPFHAAGPVLAYALVITHLDQGQVEVAHGWIQRLARDHPTSPYVNDALLRLATAAGPGRPAVARQAYRDLLARQPAPEVRADAWVGLVEAAVALGDHADAARSAETFAREAGADARAPRVQGLLIRAYQAQGRRDLALRAGEAFLARFPTDPAAPGVHLTLGQLLLEERRADAAQKALTAARDQGEPAVAAQAQFWLGEALRARGDHDGALAAYLGAVYLYPETPWAAQGLKGAAQSYLARSQAREAGIVLRKLAGAPGADPALVQWARTALSQLGPGPREAPAGPALRKGAPPRS
jgi:TolA-binding protein